MSCVQGIRVAALASVVSLVVGCGAFKTPKTPAEQANAALATEGKSGAWIGHLDGTLAPVDGKDFAFSGRSDKPLHFMGIADGHLCFAIEWKMQLINTTAAAVGDSALAAARGATFMFEARDALDYPTSAAWPDHSTNHVQSVVLANNEVTTHSHVRSDDGTTWTSDDLVTRVELCGPAPKIAPTTKFVTITVFKPDSKVPALFIWKVDGAVDSSIADASSATTTAPAEKTEPTPKTPAVDRDNATMPAAGAPVPGNLVEVMTKAGTYSTYLELVKAAGMLAQLESAGTYTVFAPTDQAFAKEPGYFVPGLLKDADALAGVVRAHISVTAYGSDALEGSKSVRIITLGGPKTVRGRKGQLKLGNSEITDEKPASNGVLWTIDGVMKN